MRHLKRKLMHQYFGIKRPVIVEFIQLNLKRIAVHTGKVHVYLNMIPKRKSLCQKVKNSDGIGKFFHQL